jgi:hypothetical protein
MRLLHEKTEPKRNEDIESCRLDTNRQNLQYPSAPAFPFAVGVHHSSETETISDKEPPLASIEQFSMSRTATNEQNPL